LLAAAVMRVLVLHDTPSDFDDWLIKECPDHEFCWAQRAEEVQSALDEFQPEAVFSIKHSEFPGPAHRPALHHPSTRWFHVGGSGYEHLGKWDPQRVLVTNSAGVLAPFHAERAMGALLALSTGLLRAHRAQRERRWEPERFATLEGRTLVIVGLGSTGQELAKRAVGFGMKVVGVRRDVSATLPYVHELRSPNKLDELWPRADVLSLNVPLNSTTRHLVDREVLSALPGHCLLLNGARGDVVDEVALIESLEAGQIGGAWLDVFQREPLPPDSPLWSMDNVAITPHSADQVEDFPWRFARLFADNLRRFVRGEDLRNVLSC
jgi:phosphoglycerate dehydrogenase-like enzyme